MPSMLKSIRILQTNRQKKQKTQKQREEEKKESSYHQTGRTDPWSGNCFGCQAGAFFRLAEKENGKMTHDCGVLQENMGNFHVLSHWLQTSDKQQINRSMETFTSFCLFKTCMPLWNMVIFCRARKMGSLRILKRIRLEDGQDRSHSRNCLKTASVLKAFNIP